MLGTITGGRHMHIVQVEKKYKVSLNQRNLWFALMDDLVFY